MRTTFDPRETGAQKPRTKASKKIAHAGTHGHERVLKRSRKTRNGAGQTTHYAPHNYHAHKRRRRHIVANDEAPCYCGDATDDCFEHADVVRDLTKYIDEDDDDEDDVEAIAPAPRQAPPAGWGKLLSA